MLTEEDETVLNNQHESPKKKKHKKKKKKKSMKNGKTRHRADSDSSDDEVRNKNTVRHSAYIKILYILCQFIRHCNKL